jgi:hypothetical protein
VEFIVISIGSSMHGDIIPPLTRGLSVAHTSAKNSLDNAAKHDSAARAETCVLWFHCDMFLAAGCHTDVAVNVNKHLTHVTF